jgi:hypothetical protein
MVVVAIFAAKRCGRCQRRDQIDPSAHQIGRKGGQSLVLAFRHARLDRDILADGIAYLA